MNSKELMIICSALIIGVLAIASVVLVTHGNNDSNVNDVVEQATAEELDSSDSSSSESNSDPLADMVGTDLYKATHSDLIIIGVVQFSDGYYKCYGGNADGNIWGYTNYDSSGNRLSSYNVGSDKQDVLNMYNSACSSSGNTVIL